MVSMMVIRHEIIDSQYHEQSMTMCGLDFEILFFDILIYLKN